MKPKRRDFRLDIIVLLGFTAAATIASFGVYRMWVGEWTKAWFDLAVVAAVAAPVIHAWRGGDSLRAGNVLAALNSAATFGACLLLGHTALQCTRCVHWMQRVMSLATSGPMSSSATTRLRSTKRLTERP